MLTPPTVAVGAATAVDTDGAEAAAAPEAPWSDGGGGGGASGRGGGTDGVGGGAEIGTEAACHWFHISQWFSWLTIGLRTRLTQFACKPDE